MKWVVVIPDGAADRPVPELGGETPLQAARTPHMDRIAAEGTCGCVQSVPQGFSPGSDVAIMSLFGYDPRSYYSGRAPLEAAAMDLELSTGEWILRCNLVRINGQVMRDYSAGGVPSEKARTAIALLNDKIDEPGVRFVSGVSYRNLMVFNGELDVKTTPPHDITDTPIEGYLPEGTGADVLCRIVAKSRIILKEIPDCPANSVWLWGQGKPLSLPSFQKRFGLRGAVITAVDLVRGLAKLCGWQVLTVPGATGDFHTDYSGKGRKAIKVLSDYDIVVVHVEAPDEAGHAGDPGMKSRSIELIDTHIVGPLLKHLGSGTEPWRMMVLPDHPTPCDIRTHSTEAVPFCMTGEGIESDSSLTFDEKICGSSSLFIDQGHRLMERFLGIDSQ